MLNMINYYKSYHQQHVEQLGTFISLEENSEENEQAEIKLKCIWDNQPGLNTDNLLQVEIQSVQKDPMKQECIFCVMQYSIHKEQGYGTA